MAMIQYNSPLVVSATYIFWQILELANMAAPMIQCGGPIVVSAAPCGKDSCIGTVIPVCSSTQLLCDHVMGVLRLYSVQAYNCACLGGGGKSGWPNG